MKLSKQMGHRPVPVDRRVSLSKGETMYKPMKSILSLSAILCIGASGLLAGNAPAVDPVPATKVERVEAAVDAHFDTRIDTWVEGVIIKLDAAEPKITIAGHKMLHASVRAEMIRDIAAKTVGLDPVLKAAKEKELELAWKEKLDRASNEDRPADIEITCKVPTQGELLVRSEDSLPNLDFVHHEKGMAALPATRTDLVLGAPLAPARNDQATVKTEVSKTTDDKQGVALGAFSQLKIGEPVYVGYASGLVNNEVHAVIKRINLQPTAPGKN